jgi:hypothetical protein
MSSVGRSLPNPAAAICRTESFWTSGVLGAIYLVANNSEWRVAKHQSFL